MRSTWPARPARSLRPPSGLFTSAPESRAQGAPAARAQCGQNGPDILPRMNQPALSAFIWSVADLLRGDYKQSEYGKVILPFPAAQRMIGSNSVNSLSIYVADTSKTDETVADIEGVLNAAFNYKAVRIHGIAVNHP